MDSFELSASLTVAELPYQYSEQFWEVSFAEFDSQLMGRNVQQPYAVGTPEFDAYNCGLRVAQQHWQSYAIYASAVSNPEL